MFIAMPCTPVGRPKRNSDLMIAKSGFRAHPVLEVNHGVGPGDAPDAVDRHRRAAQDGAERGAEGPEHRNQDDVEDDRQHRHDDAEPQRGLRIAGGAERAAQHEEHEHAEDAHEHRAQERQRLRLDVRRRVHQAQQCRRRGVAERGQKDRERRTRSGTPDRRRG